MAKGKLSLIISKSMTVTFNPKRLLSIWSGMNDRCHNPRSKHFKNYGGRLKRIFVCKKWRSSFGEFAWWALHNGYSDELTIERINNDRGYSPKNCKWITIKDQQKNKTTNVFHTIDGIRLTLTDWSEKLDLPVETLRLRLKRGWSGDKLLKKAGATSGFSNIHFDRRDNKFRVKFEINKKFHDLGRFVNLDQAIKARDIFLRKTKGA